MDVLLVNLTTAMASVAIPTGEEYAALPNPQKAALAAAVKREVTPASLQSFVQQGHYVAVFYPAAASLEAMATATHILMFRLRANGFTDLSVDLHCIGILSVADPAPVVPAALADFTLNTLVTIDHPSHLYIARGSLRNRINASVLQADALLQPPFPHHEKKRFVEQGEAASTDTSTPAVDAGTKATSSPLRCRSKSFVCTCCTQLHPTL